MGQAHGQGPWGHGQGPWAGPMGRAHGPGPMGPRLGKRLADVVVHVLGARIEVGG